MLLYGAAQSAERRGGQRAAHFELNLVRKQMLLRKGIGAAPPVQRFGGQGKVHQEIPGLATTRASSATMSRPATRGLTSISATRSARSAASTENKAIISARRSVSTASRPR